MILSINQPAYLPWLGYFERIAKSDLHVVLDHVQFEKNSYINRNKIPAQGNATMLTVPVTTKNKFGDLAIHALEIDNSKPWAKKHWRTLQQTYSKAPYFKEHAAFFEETLSKEWTHLADLNKHITQYLLDAFGIQTPLIYSSELELSKTKSELIVEICKHINATHYLSGAMGVDYLEIDQFAASGIAVAFQKYQHPTYRQLSNKHDFMPNMAAVDLLFNHGKDSLNIMLSSNYTDNES